MYSSHSHVLRAPDVRELPVPRPVQLGNRLRKKEDPRKEKFRNSDPKEAS